VSHIGGTQAPDLSGILNELLTAVTRYPYAAAFVGVIVLIGLPLLAWVVLRGLRKLVRAAAGGAERTQQPVTIRILGKLMSIEIGESGPERMALPPSRPQLWIVPNDESKGSSGEGDSGGTAQR
jgi:hypothetical protein